MMSRKHIDEQKERMRQRGVPEETIQSIFDPYRDDFDGEDDFEEADTSYRFHEDIRHDVAGLQDRKTR